MTGDELSALHIAAEEAPVTPATSGLLAVIAHCCDWELHRRLQDPQAAIGPEDIAESYTALAVFGANVILINNDTDSVLVSANGQYRFSLTSPSDGEYSVLLSAEPGDQVCTRYPMEAASLRNPTSRT